MTTIGAPAARTIIDLFAGPGGWEEGLRELGRDDVVGLEWDTAACDTASAAGHLRVQADVAQYPTAPFRDVEGLIASPPCQAFSLAGEGGGRFAVAALLDHVVACLDGWREPPASICDDDVRADLTLQPLRWVDALHPEWVALEQVPPVLPLWRAIGEVFEAWGYTVACAVLNAADHGVPQTRKRAVLVGSRTSVARLPDPTHFDPRKGGSLFGAPWVSMADALGWGYEDRGSPTVTGGGGATGGPEPFGNEARKALAATVALQSSNRPGDARRAGENRRTTTPVDRPATTITGKGTAAWVAQRRDSGPGAERSPRDVSEPSYTIRANGSGAAPAGVEWVHDRPSTTVQGDPRIGRPGHKDRDRGEAQFAQDSVRVTVEQAAILQSFRPDYPWQGTKTKQFEQVGNAVPPGLAAAVLRPLLADAREVAA